MPLVNRKNLAPKRLKVSIVKCTCGRIKYDHSDLAVIVEEDGLAYHGSTSFSPRKTGRSLIVCLRLGCNGQFRAMDNYVSKLPRMFWYEFLAVKAK